MSDDEKTAEELLSQSKNQRRHNTDAPITGGETDTDVDDTEETVDLAGAVAEVYDENRSRRDTVESDASRYGSSRVVYRARTQWRAGRDSRSRP